MRKQKTVFARSLEAPPIFQEFITHLTNDRGLSTGTIHNRKGPLLDFCKAHPWLKTKSNVRRLNPKMIQKYVSKKGKSLSNENRKAMMTSLRAFFYYLRFKDYHELDLSFSVPHIVSYALAKTPRALPLKIVEKLLSVPDRRKAIGRRDFAILNLFIKYGVRRKQVTELLIKDIDWREGTIHFRAMKGGKPIVVPMDAAVAEALLDYLKKDRRDTTYPHVFVKHQTGPSRGQPLGRALWFMVSRHLEKAGLPEKHSYRGPHALRHTVATELLRNNQPLKTIADLLGHRNINTTSIYTKVDFNSIKNLAKEWPSVKKAA